ncbi:HAMP domain-containing sensor histidine kinase [Paenibacillus sp. 102]|uniref:sensor histidine kinase n=1 Tax=Paenibacillus sp. 102 TaxID=3120823 RepID=UPI0031B9C7FB
MKINIRLSLHFILSLFICLIFMGITLMITFELIFPLVGMTEKNNAYDVIVILIFICTLILGSIVYGWYIGKPLFIIISWISTLAKGHYDEKPTKTHHIYNKKSNTLKGPYRLYKDVILNIEYLASKLREIEIERNRLDNMKQEWIAGISHDLKTPLTYITGYSTLMLSREHQWSEEEKQKFLQEIKEKGAHMEELIADLNLSFRLNDSQIPLVEEQTNIVEFTRRIVADITNNPCSSQYHFHFHTDVTNIVIPIDTKLLYRSLQNLLMNCVLHNPIGTHIKTSIYLDENVQIIIEDNGIGMDEVTVRNIFKQYYRGTTTHVSSEGTGLGMTIAHKIISAHGGSIQVESKVNLGTSLYITLPIT